MTRSSLRLRGGRAATPSRVPGAVVIGGDYQGLGIVRSLGRHGIPVCVLDDERSIARFSRYATCSARVHDLRSEDATLSALSELADLLPTDGWVLYPTRDETVAVLAGHKEELSTRYRVPTPAWDVVRWAWDKRNTYALAERLGIPAPRTWTLRGEHELDRIDGVPPFVIKPAIKEHFVYATKAKAWRADTFDQLAERYRRAAAITGADEVIVQELVPGGGEHQLAYCALFKDGRAIGKLVARRCRQHPPEFGRASTFVESVVMPKVEEPSERLLREIGYYGLVELEYKLDARDGQLKLLDINARTWGYHTLGFGAGVDFPYLLYRDQLGFDVPASHARPGVRWVRLVTDLPTGALEIARGTLGLRTYLLSIARAHVEAVFSRDDLLPGVAELALIPYLSIRRGF